MENEFVSWKVVKLEILAVSCFVSRRDIGVCLIELSCNWSIAVYDVIKCCWLMKCLQYYRILFAF